MDKHIKKGKIRADQLIVSRGLATDIIKARALIMAGQVIAGDRRIEKSGELLDAQVSLRIKGKKENVSRAGKKLAYAVEDLSLSEYFNSAVVLDVGASTGGFTETALLLGASHVIACDVGQNQLAWTLRTDSRVTSIERTDIRDLTGEKIGAVDIVLADVSFISLARIVPDLVRLGGQRALYLLLVKPQFELARELIPPGGVVLDTHLRMQAVQQVVSALKAEGIHDIQQIDSRVPGRTGNIEIFIAAKTLQHKPNQAE